MSGPNNQVLEEGTNGAPSSLGIPHTFENFSLR